MITSLVGIESSEVITLTGVVQGAISLDGSTPNQVTLVGSVTEPISLTGKVAAKGDKGDTGEDSTVPGPQGDMGPNGTTGPQGSTGPTGIKGDDGSNGLQGTVGDTGAQGPTGLDGANGAEGAIGSPGADGTNGVDGAIGLTGANGSDGSQGIPGNDGLNGSDGAQGIPGNDGATGAKGDTGDQGIQGVTGTPGADGLDGDTGPTGSNGVDGSIGLTGSDGATGADGVQGIQGAEGSPGANGAVGSPGTDGVDGADGTVTKPAVEAVLTGSITSHTHTETQVTDLDKYTQSEVNDIAALKLNISSVVNDLVTTSTTAPLSAAQGKALKDLIDTINTLLLSDEGTLDTLQEIVDFIEINKTSLDSLSIASIAGLQAALDGKLSLSGGVMTGAIDFNYNLLTRARIDKLLQINATSGFPEFNLQENGSTRAKIYYDITNNRLVFQNNENSNLDAIMFVDHLSMNNNRITSVADPVVDTDVASRGFVLQAILSSGVTTIMKSTNRNVADSSVVLLPATELANRRTIIIENNSGVDVRIGDNTVSATKGTTLRSGSKESYDIDAGLYAYQSSGATIILNINELA